MENKTLRNSSVTYAANGLAASGNAASTPLFANVTRTPATTVQSTVPSTPIIASQNSAGNLPPLPPATPPSQTLPSAPKKRGDWRKTSRLITYATAVVFLLIGGYLVFTNANKSTQQASQQVNSNIATTTIPLNDFAETGSLSLLGTKSLTINGQLRANESLILAPQNAPTSAERGQLYYDANTNALAFYNGSQFVQLTGQSNNVVQSIQGQSGNVTLVAGAGIAVNGTTIINTGVTSLGNATGDIVLGSGLSIATDGSLTNTGIISATSGSASITVTNDGNGNITISSSGAGSGTVQSPGGTTGKLAVFTGVQTIADSLISENGSLVTVTGDLSITGGLTLGTPLGVGNGGTGATTLTGNGVLVGNGTGAISSVTAASSGLCLVSTGGAPAFSSCTGAATVTSLNGLTGALSIANATGSGSTITINDASTSTKGIASFNSTNFTATSGAINTVQNINVTATPQFGTLTVTSSQATSPMLLANNTNIAASGNLIDLQLNGTSKFSVTPAGNTTLAGTLTTGLVNGQTISSAANFTGTLGVTGLATLSGGATISGTLTTNTISPTSTLNIGVTSQTLTMQGNASTTLAATNATSTTTLAFQTPTANVNYRLLTAATGTYDICTTAGNCTGVGGGVTTTGGTAGKIAKFSGSNAIADSLLSESGSTVTIAGTLAVNTLTPTGALTIGSTGQALTLQGTTTTVTATNSGTTNTLAFATPSGLGKTITIPNATGTVAVTATSPLAIDSAGNITCATCATTSGVVSSMNGLTGALSIANASGASTTITINDASTSQKGIAQFNSTNFSASSGIVNTIQDISTASTPSFGRLTVTSSQLTNGMLLVNNTNTSASGNLIDLQLNGTSKLSVDPSGALTLTGNVNGQTISSTANFTGSLGVSGLTTLSGGATVTGTLTANTITPISSLTVGATSQSFLVQGNASSTLTATNGASKTTFAFQTPTANVTYRLLTTTAGTYDICTTAGNCSGVGGGVTTPGGTTNQVAKFTASGTIADSIISDDGSTVTIGGTLAVNTITPGAAMTIGATSKNLTLQGAVTSITATSAGVTNTLTFATPTTTNKTITIPDASGTVAVSATGPLSIDAAGNITCPSCVTSGGGGGGSAAVDSVDGLAGALTIANSSGTSTTITIDNASTSQKGIAQFNSTNFSASSGTINTIQDISTASAPSFGRLTVTSSQATNGMLLVNNTNGAGSGNLIDLQVGGSSKLSVAPSGDMTLVGNLNGQTISSSANFTGTLGVTSLATLSGGATVSGTLTANTITPSGALTVGATAQSFLVQGSAASTITATNSGSKTTLAFQTPTANVTYRFLTAAAGTYDVCTTVGNCAGVGGSVTTAGGTTGKLAKFSGSNAIADSLVSESGSVVTVGGTLAVNTLTPTAALTVGDQGQNLTLQGAVTNLTSTASGVTNTLTFATPTTTGKTITIPDASGTLVVSASGPLSINAAGNISCPTCTTTSTAVTSLDGLTGALTLANSSGSSTTVTIDNASTSQKGIAQFNSTNFSASSGAINTIQNINTAATPQFGTLTLTSSQATNPMLLVNNTNGSGSGNLIDLQLSGSSKFSVAPSGDMTVVGTINGQTISSSASFSGTLGVTSLATLSGGATVSGTLTANTITPSGALTVGATSQNFLVQGSAASTITATNSGSTSTLAFQTPTANVTYRFLTAAAGTYDICTTVGNCAGVGGGVTTSGGTTGKLAKFSGSNAIADSLVSESGSTVTVGGTLAVNTLTPTAALTVGAAAQNLTLQGATVNLKSTASGITNSLTFATPTGSNKTITIPDASGTLVVSASSPLAIDSAGNITCPTCNTFSTVVTSLDGLSGGLTLANSSGSSTTITIDDASTSAKGIAQFNSTNFSASSGTINTIQNINSTATPTFASETLTGANALTLGTTGTNTGAIVFKGSTAASASITLIGQANPTSNTITLPNATGTVCLQSSSSCNFAASDGSNANYIQNQSSGAQSTSSFWISGSGRSDTSFITNSLTATTSTGTITLDTTGAGTVAIANANATTLTVGNSSAAATITGSTVGVQGTTVTIDGTAPGASATQTVNIANAAQTNSSSVIAVNILSGGSSTNGTASLLMGNNARVTQIDLGNVAAAAARTINIGSGANTVGVDTINLGTGATTVAGGKTIHIGDGTPTGSGTNLVTIGSNAASANHTLIQGGNDASALAMQVATSGTISLGTVNTNTVNIGNSSTSLTVTSTGFNVSSAGVITLPGAQTQDLTTSSGANGLTIQPATLASASGTGAGVTIKGGDESGTTTAVGGMLTLQGGAATGASGTRTGGNVVVDAGAGSAAASDGTLSVGTNHAATITIGAASGTRAASLLAGSGNVTLQSNGGSTVIKTTTSGATTPVAIIQGGASPGAGGDLLQVQDSSNNVLSRIDSTGKLSMYNISGGTAFVTADPANSNFYVGNPANCGGRFCVANSVLNPAGSTSATNSFNITSVSGTSASGLNNTYISQDITLTDTSTTSGGGQNTLRGIRIDMSSTNNTGDSLNGLLIKIPSTSSSSNYAGNGIQIQNGSTNTFRLTNTGNALFQTTANSANAFLVQNSTSHPIFSVDTNGAQVVLGDTSTTGLLKFANSTNSNQVGITSGAAGSSYTLTLPTTAPSTSQCLGTDSSTSTQLVFTSCGGSGSIIQAPTSTATNTISPATTAVVALTVNGTNTGTAAQALIVNQSLSGAGTAEINSTNTSGTQTDGLLVNRNGSGGTTTNGIDITQTAGTLTNGIAFTGTIGTDIKRGTGTLTIQGGSGIQLNSATTVSVASSSSALTVSNGSATLFNVDTTSAIIGVGATGSSSLATSINIGSTSGATQTITVGNTSATGTNVAIQGGNGASAVSIQAATSGTISIGTTNTNTVNINKAGATLTLAGTVVIGGVTDNVTFDGTTHEPTLNGAARHTVRIALSPEFQNVTMTPDSGCSTCTGTMTSDNDIASPYHNFYNWTTTQASNQHYDLWVKVPIPSDFSAWASTTNPTIYAYAKTSDTTNGTVQIATYDSTGASVQSLTAVTPNSTNTWTENSVNQSTGSFTYTAGGYLILQIRVQAPQNGNTKLGELRVDYLSKW